MSEYIEEMFENMTVGELKELTEQFVNMQLSLNALETEGIIWDRSTKKNPWISDLKSNPNKGALKTAQEWIDEC